MIERDESILYLGAALPSRSETFVYREVLALRRRGWNVRTMSVHPPEKNLGAEQLDALAAETKCVYDRSRIALVIGSLSALLWHPIRTVRTLFLGLTDACRPSDVPNNKRLRVVGQCVASIVTGTSLLARAGTLPPRHIHSHMAHVPTTIAMHLARFLGVSFSWTGHANDLFRERTLLRAKLRRASFVACISEWHRSFYRQAEPNASCAMPIVRCGVNTDDFTPRNHEPGEPLHVVGVGRFVAKKGFDVLIEAIGQLRDSGVPFRCTLLGDGPEMPALRSLCASKGLDEVISMPGAAPNETIRSMLRTADIFALPCRVDAQGDRDGIPVVLMEAMASGVPVVSGDLPTIRELIEHDSSGLLVDPGSVDQLVSALARLRADAVLRSRLARAGRARVVEAFSESVNVDQLERSFRVVLSCGRPSEHPTTARMHVREPDAEVVSGVQQ